MVSFLALTSLVLSQQTTPEPDSNNPPGRQPVSFATNGPATLTATLSPDGFVQYGALQIDQRVPAAKPQHYLIEWKDW